MRYIALFLLISCPAMAHECRHHSVHHSHHIPFHHVHFFHGHHFEHVRWRHHYHHREDDVIEANVPHKGPECPVTSKLCKGE